MVGRKLALAAVAVALSAGGAVGQGECPDYDGDARPDACDNCPIIFNPAQEFDEACTPLEGRVRVRRRRVLGFNSFSVAVFGEGFDRLLLFESAMRNKLELEILEGEHTIYSSQLPAGEIRLRNPRVLRFKYRGDEPSAIDTVTIRIGRNGKLRLRVKGCCVLTPTGEAAARVHFGPYRLATVGKHRTPPISIVDVPGCCP